MATSPEQQSGTIACTVTQAMTAAKRGLEQIRLTVSGEVSQFKDKANYSAAYFTIKDESSVMDCQMWHNLYAASGVELSVGMLVEVTGKFSCYPKRGTMSFTANTIKILGEGDLYVKMARIAEKLEAEGLLADSRKKRINPLPRRIAVVTSPTGEAVHDCLRTLQRSHPFAEVQFFGVQVEGKGAEDKIIAGLAAAQQVSPAPDVILLVRGGGAYESLMPFNDERVARAIAASTIPIISGIGHEPQTTVADLVADRRASTPTGAAIEAGMPRSLIATKVRNATNALNKAMAKYLEGAHHRLSRLSERPVFTDEHCLTGSVSHELDYLSDRLMAAGPPLTRFSRQELTGLDERLKRAIPDSLAADRERLVVLTDRIRRIGSQLNAAPARDVASIRMRLASVGPALVGESRKTMALSAAQLEALSPLKVLGRGYSITYADDGRTVIDSVEGAEAGQAIKVRVTDGTLECSIDSIERGE